MEPEYSQQREIRDQQRDYMSGLTLERLRGMSDDELVKRFDLLSRPDGRFRFGPDDYLHELRRREVAKQGKTMLRLTVAVTVLALVSAVLALVSVITVGVQVSWWG